MKKKRTKLVMSILVTDQQSGNKKKVLNLRNCSCSSFNDLHVLKNPAYNLITFRPICVHYTNFVDTVN